jgi:ABC-type Fe3+-hydroxamate transport system substrate-binding protein
MGLVPKRIVSLVPSITETLYDLGLEEEVVGITKFCIHPNTWFRTKVRVGGTKNASIDIIRDLEPDLVIANKEENVAEQVNQLAAFSNVWLTDIATLSDATNMIEDCGLIVGKSAEGKMLSEAITAAFNKISPTGIPKKTVYLIWRNPYMAAGGDTFIHDMMERIGLFNVFSDSKRYPEVTLEVLQQANPDLVLLSSEPYPFGENHLTELSAYLPNARIALVDGEMFSWYGSHLKYATAYFSQLLHVWKQSL